MNSPEGARQRLQSGWAFSSVLFIGAGVIVLAITLLGVALGLPLSAGEVIASGLALGSGLLGWTLSRGIGWARPVALLTECAIIGSMAYSTVRLSSAPTDDLGHMAPVAGIGNVLVAVCVFVAAVLLVRHRHPWIVDAAE